MRPTWGQLVGAIAILSLFSCSGDNGKFTEQDAIETWCAMQVHLDEKYYDQYDCSVPDDAYDECLDEAEDVFDVLEDYAQEETIACFECLNDEAGTSPTNEEYNEALRETCEDQCDENGVSDFNRELDWRIRPDCDTCGHTPDFFDDDDDDDDFYPGPDLCCGESDPCDLADNGVCDCLGCDWDRDSCKMCEDYDGWSDCCMESDPCDYADDGECDCDGYCSWEESDC